MFLNCLLLFLFWFEVLDFFPQFFVMSTIVFSQLPNVVLYFPLSFFGAAQFSESAKCYEWKHLQGFHGDVYWERTLVWVSDIVLNTTTNHNILGRPVPKTTYPPKLKIRVGLSIFKLFKSKVSAKSIFLKNFKHVYLSQKRCILPNLKLGWAKSISLKILKHV